MDKKWSVKDKNTSGRRVSACNAVNEESVRNAITASPRIQ